MIEVGGVVLFIPDPMDFFDLTENEDSVFDKLKYGEQPEIEDRRRYRTQAIVAEELSKFFRFRPDELEYRPIPEAILSTTGSGIAWTGPTPKPIQEVIDVISQCWKECRELGYVVGLRIPTGMTDGEVVITVSELNLVLHDEFGAWGGYAGFDKSPAFVDLSMESKRTLVARIQEVIHRTGLKERMSE